MYNCKYCKKDCKNDNRLRNLERLCALNPDRQNNPALNRPAWNRGLTSQTDSRVLSGDNLSKAIRTGIDKSKAKGTYTCTGRASSEERELERKRKISEKMKLVGGGYRHGSGRGKKGKYKGYYCDSTYELVYIIYNIDHNIPFKRCELTYTYEIEGKAHKYYPDFELSDGSLVEIKGYYNELVDIKISSVKDRPIKVLFEKDLEYAFNWVKENYTYKNLSELYD